MLRRIILIVAAIVITAALAAVGLVWWVWSKFTGPIYEPGSLAATAVIAPTAPAPDDDASTWTVAPGIELHHGAFGSGPPVLFVHGGPGVPVRAPMPWLAALADERTVHLYDQRGCGDSTRPFDRLSEGNWYANMQRLEPALGLGAQVADIERIRRLLGVERLDLVGHSFGGLLATMYAAEFPDRVGHLVLLAPADMLRMPNERPDLFRLVRQSLPVDERPAWDAQIADYLDFGRLFERDEAELATMNRNIGDRILRAMGREPAPDAGDAPAIGGWMVHAMYLSMGRRHDYRPALARITAPTLVVHGARDLQPVGAARAYADRIDGAELLEVEGADHFFDGDLPELTERVRAFLGR